MRDLSFSEADAEGSVMGEMGRGAGEGSLMVRSISSSGCGGSSVVGWIDEKPVIMGIRLLIWSLKLNRWKM